MRIDYQTENRAEVLESIAEQNLSISEDVMINLDPELLKQGIERHTTCYIIAEPAAVPPADPQIKALDAIVANQDQIILDLTYENILLKEGLL